MRKEALAFVALASIACSPGHADSLGYSIYSDTGDARTLLATGIREYTVNDLDVRPIWRPPVVPSWDSSIELEGGFRVGVFTAADKDPGGFGLWVRNDANPHEFSWNWFHHDGGQIYTKIKGPGRVRVQLAEIDGAWQMTTIEFLDDVELTYQQNMCETRVGAVSHVVLVTRGSVLSVAPRSTAEANTDRAKRNAPLCPKGSARYKERYGGG